MIWVAAIYGVSAVACALMWCVLRACARSDE